jgi:hypothetical protein
MNTGEEMAEFVIVWDLVLEVQINEQEDEIVWRYIKICLPCTIERHA